MKKAIIIVLDSVGIGALPDADDYGDGGSNTLGHVLGLLPGLELPNLSSLGLDRLCPALVGRSPQRALPYGASTAVLAEASQGKDTVTGHWEMMGVITGEAFPVFPKGFPQQLLTQLEQLCGVTFLGNEVASGTEIINRLGAEHMATGQPILYTSADSVLQIAAHEKVISVSQLYAMCSQIRMQLQPPYQVARVIARPFIGQPGAFQRTANRHDYALAVPEENLLQDLLVQGFPVGAVGKIQDIFVGVDFTEGIHTVSDDDGMNKLLEMYAGWERGLIFVNLVDFDMKYGHRRDGIGYGANLAAFDQRLAELLEVLDEETLLLITADHGCDPLASGTDHTREYVPLLCYGAMVDAGKDIGHRRSFADLGATLAQWFGAAYTGAGESFAKEVLINESI